MRSLSFSALRRSASVISGGGEGLPGGEPNGRPLFTFVSQFPKAAATLSLPSAPTSIPASSNIRRRGLPKCRYWSVRHQKSLRSQ